jgi:hypothetical protein
MAAVMGATYPDLYAAVGVHSGLPYRSAADLPSAFAAMRGDARLQGWRSRKSRGTGDDSPRVRTIIFHGDADNIVHPSNATNMLEAERAGDIEAPFVLCTVASRRLPLAIVVIIVFAAAHAKAPAETTGAHP